MRAMVDLPDGTVAATLVSYYRWNTVRRRTS
jgi:hypothetical protein